jgi:hypothetical protein
MNPERPLLPATILLAVVLCGTDASAELVVLADRAEGILAELVRIDEAQVELAETPDGEPTQVPASALLEIQFSRSSELEDDECEIRSWGGDVWRGTILGGSRTSLELYSRALGEISIPLTELASIRTGGIDRADPPTRREEEDIVHLEGGDFLTGTIDGFSAEGVTIDSAALGGTRTFPHGEWTEIELADLGGRPEPDEGLRRVQVALRDGSRITASLLGYESGVLRLIGSSGRSLEVERAALASMVCLDGDFLWLSRLPLHEATIECELPFESTMTYPPVADASPWQPSLATSSRAFARGLSTHSRSLLVYEIPDGYTHFLATVGLDASVDPDDPSMDARLADVVCRVRVASSAEEIATGRVLWESGRLRAMSPDQDVGPLALDGEDAVLLILETDPADKYHVLDRVVWGAARLVP